VVGRQNADIASTLHLRDVAMATIFWLTIYGCTSAPPGEYDWTVRVWRRCGLMSNYFDHSFILLRVLCTIVHCTVLPFPVSLCLWRVWIVTT